MKKGNYNRFWRWHFYAALFITPLLITLTLTGIGYLFYTNVENVVYKDFFFGEGSSNEQLSIDQGIEKAKEQYKGYDVTKIIVLDDPYNTRLTMTNDAGEERYVFLDNHNQIVGSQNSKYTFSNVMRNTHSSLFVGGTIVNYLVELAACWAVFLLLSGIYMTVKSRVLKRRQKSTTRQRNKKWHALIGTIITIPMVIIIFTGLPWSAFMGNIINTVAHDNPSIGVPILTQEPPTSDINEIPWATRENETPTSNKPDSHGHHGVSKTNTYDNSNMIQVQTLMKEIKKSNISKPYSIVYPSDEEGVYTVSKASNSGVTGLDVSPYDEITSYFDQYSGNLISHVSYEDYGILKKWFTWGIPLHEGHLFGWPNKLINLTVCLAFLFVILWGIKTWLSRKKRGELSAPPKVPTQLSAGFIIFMITLGIIMPLFGISLILVIITELLILIINKYKAKA
ncbi:PepSY domain-containing protein [Virgibacillus sp. AGTR]|uniref:PepSY-associated TM helix domain-containing protein n=1 Tax=Virgibacillus sp. AGTR TaxID=2812055 RepID=UPI001D16EF71|nr:PepSY domain-containing protein [Virgibacillus sp. AGTR]MCC2251366.1 PepSY domain-containing protein [Virgibacillus sp. AGTR]